MITQPLRNSLKTEKKFPDCIMGTTVKMLYKYWWLYVAIV
jgi:hypothetical protein